MKKLTHESLASHLEGGEPAQAYLVYGGEELLVDECRLDIRRSAKHDELVVLQAPRKVDFPGMLKENITNQSLFSESRHVEVLLGTDADAKAGEALLGVADKMRNSPDRLVVCMHGVDGRTQKTKWFGELCGAFVTVAVPTIGKDALPKWVSARLAKSGRKLTPDAMDFFVEMTEGNLLAASQEIQKICLLFPEGTIGEEDLGEELVKLSRHNTFALQGAIESGSFEQASRMLDNLRVEGAPEPLVLWILADEVRALISVAEGRKHPGVWGARRTVLERTVRRGEARGSFLKLLSRVQRADLSVRGLTAARSDPWNDFLSVTFLLCQAIRGSAT